VNHRHRVPADLEPPARGDLIAYGVPPDAVVRQGNPVYDAAVLRGQLGRRGAPV